MNFGLRHWLVLVMACALAAMQLRAWNWPVDLDCFTSTVLLCLVFSTGASLAGLYVIAETRLTAGPTRLEAGEWLWVAAAVQREFAVSPNLPEPLAQLPWPWAIFFGAQVVVLVPAILLVKRSPQWRIGFGAIALIDAFRCVVWIEDATRAGASMVPFWIQQICINWKLFLAASLVAGCASLVDFGVHATRSWRHYGGLVVWSFATLTPSLFEGGYPVFWTGNF